MSWLDGLKVAIIQKDTQRAFAHIQELPESFATLDGNAPSKGAYRSGARLA